MTRQLLSIIIALSLLGLASTVVAQDSLQLLDGSSDRIVLAQSKKKKKKKKKAEDSESKKDEEEGEGDEEEEDEEEESADAGPAATLQRGNRMEFDGRLIRGETAGSGAVFLFQRVPRPLPSMVKKRESYLANTVQTVFGQKRVEQFEKTKVEAKKEIEKEGESKKLKGKTE